MRATRRVVPFAAAVAVSVAAVASAASGFNGVEGQQFSGQVGSVFLACSGSDPNFNCSGMPATMSGASVKWGDGVTVTSTATKDSCDTGAGHCVYSVNGSHTYAEEAAIR